MDKCIGDSYCACSLQLFAWHLGFWGFHTVPVTSSLIYVIMQLVSPLYQCRCVYTVYINIYICIFFFTLLKEIFCVSIQCVFLHCQLVFIWINETPPRVGSDMGWKQRRKKKKNEQISQFYTLTPENAWRWCQEFRPDFFFHSHANVHFTAGDSLIEMSSHSWKHQSQLRLRRDAKKSSWNCFKILKACQE